MSILKRCLCPGVCCSSINKSCNVESNKLNKQIKRDMDMCIYLYPYKDELLFSFQRMGDSYHLRGVAQWMSLENSIVCEVWDIESQSCMIPLTCRVEKYWTCREVQSAAMASRAWNWKKGSMLVKEQLCRMNQFCKSNIQSGDYINSNVMHTQNLLRELITGILISYIKS